jgi:hypothetical protein
MPAFAGMTARIVARPGAPFRVLRFTCQTAMHDRSGKLRRPGSPALFFLPRTQVRGMERRDGARGFCTPKPDSKRRARHTLVRRVGPLRSGPASRRSTGGTFRPGPRFPGRFCHPDQPAPGGRTVVSSRRSPGSPGSRLRACPQEAASRPAATTSHDNALGWVGQEYNPDIRNKVKNKREQFDWAGSE